MQYIILPAEIFTEVTQETLDKLSLSPRYSVDNTEVIMKLSNFYLLFPQVNTLEEDGEPVEIPFPVYTSGTEEFETLMQSDSWTSNTEGNDEQDRT